MKRLVMARSNAIYQSLLHNFTWRKENIKYIQNQLGHASIQTTLDRYEHLLKDVNTEQAKKLDSILGFGNDKSAI